MDKLRTYLNSLKPAEQADFARRCGTTVGYLRKAISVRQRLAGELAIAIERESRRAVVCEDVRPDADWAVVRSPAPTGSDAAHVSA